LGYVLGECIVVSIKMTQHRYKACALVAIVKWMVHAYSIAQRRCI